MTPWDGKKRREADEAMEEIKAKLATLLEGQKITNRMLERHDHAIFGNDKAGLITEVAILKQHKANTEKTAHVVWVTAIGLVCKTIWDTIRR